MALGEDVMAQVLANKQKRDAEKPVVPVVTNQNGISGEQLAATVPVVAPQAPESSQNTEKNNLPPVSQSTQTNSQIPPNPPPPAQESVTPTATEKKEGSEEVKPEVKPNEGTVIEEEIRWDEGIPETTAQVSTEEKIDFKKISSALELEIKSESELVSFVKEKLDRLKNLETTSNFEGVPDVLKQAMEVAKKGGDWLSYAGVSAVDVSKFDPIELFNREYERVQIHRFRNLDGSFDYEKFDAELGAIPEGVKAMQGEQIKSQLVNQQKTRQAQILAESVAKQEAFQKKLGEAATNLSKILPKESFGIVIEPKHSAFLYEGIAKGTLIKKHLGDIDPSLLAKMNPEKLIKAIGLLEWGEKMSEFRYKQGETAGKKSLLNTAQNPVLNTPASSPPTPVEAKVEPMNPTEELRKMKEKQQPKNSL